MRQQSKLSLSRPNFIQTLQRRLVIPLAVILLLMIVIAGVSLAYAVSFNRWEVWLSVGGAMLLLGGLAIWLVIRISRQQIIQQWPAFNNDLENKEPAETDRSSDQGGADSRSGSESQSKNEGPGGQGEAGQANQLRSALAEPPQKGQAPNPSQLELARLKQTEAELIQRNRQLTILQSAGVAITSSLDLRHVLDTVAQEMTRLVGVESCTICEWHQAENSISRAAKYDSSGWWSPASLSQVRSLADYPVTKAVLTEQIPEQMAISQPYLDPAELAYMRAANLKTRVILPMIFQQYVIGLVELEDSQVERIFTGQEISLIKLLANQAGSAIENARLYEQAQQEIEERQRAEAALEEERALLAQRVKERTVKLSKANAELARAARLKDEFLANMSHELRTPLNVVLGSAELLNNEVFGDLNEKQHKYVNNVHESGQHLLSLITDILDLSKIEAGRLEIDIRPVPVDSLCQASMRLVKQLAHKKQLQVSLDIDENIKILAADERRLKQVLVNLLSNAIKFTPEGGQIGLEVAGDAAGHAVHFTVWDTGIGISAEDMTTLFQPFMQVDSSLSRQQEGTGLGLSLVSRLTELHGGSVTVESEVEVGSRFTISLPWSESIEPRRPAEEDEPELAPKSDLAAGSRAGGKSPLILMAEDNDQNIEMLLGFLQAQGYQINIAHDGQEAIERALEEKPDLILMDIQMPGMDGLEATRRLRAETTLADVPVIALTALVMPNDKERCLEAGMNDYLSKPVSPSRLVRTIETYLNRTPENEGIS